MAAGWTLIRLLMGVLVGFLLLPAMVVVTVVPFAHASYAAYEVSRGEQYRYPMAAKLAEAV